MEELWILDGFLPDAQRIPSFEQIVNRQWLIEVAGNEATCRQIHSETLNLDPEAVVLTKLVQDFTWIAKRFGVLTGLRVMPVRRKPSI